MGSLTKNDVAWQKIFEKYNTLNDIETDGQVLISAGQINEFREARLMTKFDHRSNLPLLFKDNGLSILPVTRGKYVIGHFEAYHDFENRSAAIKRIPVPQDIESIDFYHITSEASAINVAYLSGMLEDFTGDTGLKPTVNGRMSSEHFEFNIEGVEGAESKHLVIQNAQLEIDGGFEGSQSLVLIEAKNTLSSDFLIRQLYYPYKLWHSKIEKDVRPVFLVYSNGVFSFYEYAFEDSDNYNSLVLIKQKNYELASEGFTFETVKAMAESVTIEEEPEDVPFPQANKFSRIINILEILYEEGSLSQETITCNYDFGFVARQTIYYTAAAKYLGLLERIYDKEDGVAYQLSEKGVALMSMKLDERNLAFIGAILSKKVFNETFKLRIQTGDMPTKETIAEIMKTAGVNNVDSDSTYIRRASTVIRWIDWLMQFQDEEFVQLSFE